MLRVSRVLQPLSRGLVWFGVAALLACTVSLDSEGEPQSHALIDRLPGGATAIAWVDVEQLAAVLPEEQWEAYQEMMEVDENVESFERFVDATGFDPRTDLRQLAFAALPQGAEQVAPVVMLSATFDQSRLESFLLDSESIDYEGSTFYALDEALAALEAEVAESEKADAGPADVQTSDEEPGYLVVLDPTTVALGTADSLKVIIDVEGGRHDSLKMDPHINDLISDVAAEGQIWFVATRETWESGLDSLGASGAPVPVTAVESIETLMMSMRLGDGMVMRLAGIAATAEDATLLADSLNGLTAMGKMMLQQNEPELFEIVDRALQVGSDDRTVRIEANLTDVDLEVLRRLAEEQASEGAGVSGS